MARITLKKGRHKSLRLQHPWVFANAVAKVSETPQPGATVEVISHDGQHLGHGAYSPESQLRVRMWSFNPRQTIDRAFFDWRIGRALAGRQRLGIDSNAYRLINGESDGLPGLVVDRYADFLVCQITACGVEHRRDDIVSVLKERIDCAGIYERSDVGVRAKEGLQQRTGTLAGQEPPALVEIHESGHRFLVDIKQGHKTGFYLDQRDNRASFGAFTAGAEVLNCFAYTGAFAVAGLTAGAAHVTNIESSAPALALAKQQLELNLLGSRQVTDIEDNVFQLLRRYRAESRKFDLIVLDPPKFVDTRSQLVRGGRGYKDINLLALQLIRSGGYLFTFSCSGLLEAKLFQKIVFDASLDAKREVQIVSRMSQAGDHPTALTFPEGSYLKGLICRVW